MIREMNNQTVADIRANEGPRNVAVVSPCVDGMPGRDGHMCDAGIKIKFDSLRVAQWRGNAETQSHREKPSHLHMSVIQIDSSVRFGGGTGIPLSVISFRRSAALSGCGSADWTPTRTRPSA